MLQDVEETTLVHSIQGNNNIEWPKNLLVSDVVEIEKTAMNELVRITLHIYNFIKLFASTYGW